MSGCVRDEWVCEDVGGRRVSGCVRDEWVCEDVGG